MQIFVNPRARIYQDARKKLSERLREARKSLGLTQGQVCVAMGRPKTWLSKVEKNEQRVHGIELLMFATLYRKELSYFSIALEPVISEALTALANIRQTRTS